MSKRFFKYFVCLLFVLTQVQIFANKNTTHVSWTKNIIPEAINIYDYLPKVFGFNSIIVDNDLKLDVTVSNTCVNDGLSNPYTYTFSIENMGNLPITLSSSNKITVKIEMPSNSNGDFDNLVLPTGWTYNKDYQYDDVNYDYTVTSQSSGSNTIFPRQKITFTASRSYTIASQGNSRILNASLTYEGDQNTSNNNSSSKIYRKLSDIVEYKEISNSTFTYKSLISRPQDYTFYELDSDNIIDSSLEISQSTPKKIEFEIVPIGEDCRTKVTVFIGTDPGEITVSDNLFCFGDNVLISNKLKGDGSGGYLLKYTWEVSYDNGLTWGAPEDTTDVDVDGFESITINNVTSNLLVRRKAHERPTNTRDNRYAYTNPVAINVVKNNIIFPEGTTNVVATRLLPGETTANTRIPVVRASIPGSTITYYNQNGDLIATNPTGNFIAVNNLAVGEHIFEVRAENTISENKICTVSEQIKVIVYNANDCSSYTKRTFATHYKGWTSGLSGYKDLEKLTDGNRASAGEINGGIVLLGIGTVGVDLYFTDGNGNLLDLTNKKVVIKIGEQYSGLKVAGGISVRGIKTERTVNNLSVAPNLVGATFGVKGGVLDALKGDNVFEFSFTPATSISSTGTPVQFNGVRVQLGSLIGVADLATVFYAYIEDEGKINGENDITTAQYCQLINQEIKVTPPASLQYPTTQKNSEGAEIGGIANTDIKLNRSVEDAFWGNYSEVLNVASSLNPVVFPYYAVDDNYDSYSIFSTTVGALNAQFLQAKLRQTARLGDQVQITLSYPNISVLNLSLLQLGNFKLVYYLDGAKVGEEKLEDFRVLDIGLFRFRDNRRVVLSKPVEFMFDKVELTQFSVVNVNLGQGLRIHDIRINPLLAFDSQKDPKDITPICVASPIVIEKPDNCTTYKLSFARVTKFGTQNYISIKYNDEGQEISREDVLDYKGNKIYPIEEIADLTQEELLAVGVNNTVFESSDYGNQLKAYFRLNFKKLLVGDKYEDGKLLIKLQAVRQGCDYGEPQYLRVDLKNCNSAFVNPVIKNTTKFK